VEDYRRSFRADRRLDFPLWDRSERTTPMALGIGAVRMSPDAMMDYATSIHGSPYDYDRQVPFLLLAPGTGTPDDAPPDRGSDPPRRGTPHRPGGSHPAPGARRVSLERRGFLATYRIGLYRPTP